MELMCTCGTPGENYGGARGNRTPDILLAKQALSQLSYSPTNLDWAARLHALAVLLGSHFLFMSSVLTGVSAITGYRTAQYQSLWSGLRTMPQFADRSMPRRKTPPLLVTCSAPTSFCRTALVRGPPVCVAPRKLKRAFGRQCRVPAAAPLAPQTGQVHRHQLPPSALHGWQV